MDHAHYSLDSKWEKDAETLKLKLEKLQEY